MADGAVKDVLPGGVGRPAFATFLPGGGGRKGGSASASDTDYNSLPTHTPLNGEGWTGIHTKLGLMLLSFLPACSS